MKNSAETQITNCETIENNKLIAEFMGIKYNPEGKREFVNNEWIYNKVEFHSSWNWLMLVVEKILNLQDAYAQERQKVFSSITPSINTTYTAVISFIKWYNENK